MTEWIISTSVLIIIVAVLRYILRGRINLRLQYALWALVLLRALLPFALFTSPMSVMNAVDKIEPLRTSADLGTVSPALDHIEFVPDADNDPADSASTGTIVGYYPGDSDKQFPTVIVPNATAHEYPAVEKAMELRDALLVLWVCGAVILALIFLCANLRFGFQLRHGRRELELQGNLLPVYICPGIETPCLFGFFRPAVYLTPGCESDQTVLRHVLAHEFTHYRHGDNIWAILRCVCLALHWYNPLVWLAAFLSMRDAELACDEGAIRRLGESERTNYGRTLIGMTCRHGSVRALALTATTMTGSKKGIKERILLIAKKPRMALYTLATVLLIAAAAVGCTFSGAEDKAETNGFTPDYMNITSDVGSVANDPVRDPETVQEFYELYLSLETGDMVEKSGGTELILGFGSSESEEIQSCIINSDGLLCKLENSGFVYYELKNGKEIYEKIYAQYNAMVADTLFSPTEVYLSRNGYSKEMLFTDYPDTNELYVQFKVASGNATEIDEKKVDKSDPIYAAFTDGSTTRRVILYSDGCYSPEPEEWETDRKYYRLGSIDNCGTQGLYMLFETYCNFWQTDYADDYVPIIIITGAAEDWDLSGEVPTMVEYYNARIDLPHVAKTNAVSSTAAMWLLSQEGRFDTVYLLNTTDSTKRAEWLAEDLYLIADNVVTDPDVIAEKTGWTAANMESTGIALEDGLSLRLGESIPYATDADLLNMAALFIQSRIHLLSKQGITITDAVLTGLTEVHAGTITEKGIGARMFLLEYRLEPESLAGFYSDDVICSSGGWITEETSLGQPYIIASHGENGYSGFWDWVYTNQLATTYSTPEMMEKYNDDPYVAACMECIDWWRNAFSFTGDNEALVEYYAEEVWPYEHLAGGAPVGDDPAAITDFKTISNQLIAVSVTGDKIVGHMSIAVTPLQLEGNGYWDAFGAEWGSGEYEGMLMFSSYFELCSSGGGRWYCSGTGTGGFGGWGYIPMDFEDSKAVLKDLELWLSYGEDYDENILTILTLADWYELEHGDYDIDISELFTAIRRAAIGDDYFTSTFSNDQLYRDLYVMKAIFNSDGAYTDLLCSVLLEQYEYDSAAFETALTYFNAEQQKAILDFVDYARG